MYKILSEVPPPTKILEPLLMSHKYLERMSALESGSVEVQKPPLRLRVPSL